MSANVELIKARDHLRAALYLLEVEVDPRAKSRDDLLETVAELVKDLDLARLQTKEAQRYVEALMHPTEDWRDMARKYLKSWGLHSND